MDGPNVGFILPEVSEALPRWELVADCVRGEDVIKSKGKQYLPAPEESDPDTLESRYRGYSERAMFFNFTGRTLEGLCGQIFSKSPTINLPKVFDPIVEDIDGAGNSLVQQSKATLCDVLAMGRSGLLVDYPQTDGQPTTLADLETGRIRPTVARYKPNQIINWRQEQFGATKRLSKLVLTESKIVEDDGFQAKRGQRWRVYETTLSGVIVSVYRKEDKKFILETQDPVIANGQPMSEIPFAFVGAVNNDVKVDSAPLYPLARINIKHYQVFADICETAYLEGNPTLVLTGLDQSWVDRNLSGGIRLGARSPLPLPGGADAKLLVVSSTTMNQELAKDLVDYAKSIGAKLIEPTQTKQTATEALIEEVSEMSVLTQAAKNVSEAYRKALTFAGQFLGQEIDPEFELNTEPSPKMANAQDRAQLVNEWQSGLISFAEAREVLRRNQIATLDDDDAKELIDAQPI